MERISLRIEGMHCDGCVRRVRKLLEQTGATEIHDVEVGRAEISVSPDGPEAFSFKDKLEEAGFTVTVNS